jgi:aminodeoxyfutalosine synthase
MTLEYIVETSADKKLGSIYDKVINEKRISTGECHYLYENGSLGFLGSLANIVRERKHGHTTYFNRNFHIEPTNVCIYDCKFCSYSRLIKKRKEGWEYSMDDIMNIIFEYDRKPVTEVHIVGGVLPRYDLKFYIELFKKIKDHRKDLHIKALTPVEFHYIFKKARVDYKAGLKQLREAGLDSIPGGGAEIFHDEIRQKIAAEKCSTRDWLRLHSTWHEMGGRSNATILYGHIESYKHRVHHMELLRQLQDTTRGFQTYIPLKFRNKDNEMSHVPEISIVEDLRNYAVSRIFLDNFDHIKAYWPMISRSVAQLALSFGVDDIDGTIDDSTKIYSMAGAEEQTPVMTSREIVNLIKDAGRRPVERDTLYNHLKDYSHVIFEQDNEFRGYPSFYSPDKNGG